MDERLRQTVRERAAYRCEYCSLPQDAEPFFAYHVEHVVARQHGETDAVVAGESEGFRTDSAMTPSQRVVSPCHRPLEP